MNTDLNIENVPTHSEITDQTFIMTANSSAVFDVNSLANAFNLDYKQFMGQQFMINSFGFTDAELSRLDHIMAETVASGLVPNYQTFSIDDKKKLDSICGAIIDNDFFMIFDKLYQMNAIFDPNTLNTNTYLHAWKIYSYNPFANSVFFVEKTQ